MNYLTLVPAYGRDYKTAAAVKADWQAGKDFIISNFHHPDDGRPINTPVPANTTLNIRFNRLTKVCQIKP
tara:strand:+ start:319 stop:528 length:210 start_codon:yes stop_codon:yes gene_type:complete